MSVVVSTIYNNEIVMCADTQLTNMVSLERQNGAKKITSLEVGGHSYLMAFTGIADRIGLFLKELIYRIELSDQIVSSEIISFLMHQILKDYRIQNLHVTLGGFNEKQPVMYKITHEGVEFFNEGYCIMLPNIEHVDVERVQKTFEFVTIPTRRDILERLKGLICYLSDLDQGRTIDKGFFYGVLLSSSEFYFVE